MGLRYGVFRTKHEDVAQTCQRLAICTTSRVAFEKGLPAAVAAFATSASASQHPQRSSVRLGAQVREQLVHRETVVAPRIVPQAVQPVSPHCTSSCRHFVVPELLHKRTNTRLRFKDAVHRLVHERRCKLVSSKARCADRNECDGTIARIRAICTFRDDVSHSSDELSFVVAEL